MKAYGPTGYEIAGTLDVVDATATILPSTFRKDADGRLDFEYAGESEVDWDTQRTKTRNTRRLFIDEEGGVWTEDEITLTEQDPAEEEISCPVNDPECLGGEGDCHDACEMPESERIARGLPLPTTDDDRVGDINSRHGVCHGTCIPREG